MDVPLHKIQSVVRNYLEKVNLTANTRSKYPI